MMAPAVAMCRGRGIVSDHMASINYDRDGRPKITKEAYAEGATMVMRPFSVSRDEPEAVYGDNTGVSFVAFRVFLPRKGERFKLDDGTSCQVVKVFYGLSRMHTTGFRAFVPTVPAVRISPERIAE